MRPWQKRGWRVDRALSDSRSHGKKFHDLCAVAAANVTIFIVRRKFISRRDHFDPKSIQPRLAAYTPAGLLAPELKRHMHSLPRKTWARLLCDRFPGFGGGGLSWGGGGGSGPSSTCANRECREAAACKIYVQSTHQECCKPQRQRLSCDSRLASFKHGPVIATARSYRIPKMR